MTNQDTLAGGVKMEALPCPFCGLAFELVGEMVKGWRHPLHSLEEARCPGATTFLEIEPERDDAAFARWNTRAIAALPATGAPDRSVQAALHMLKLIGEEVERHFPDARDAVAKNNIGYYTKKAIEALASSLPSPSGGEPEPVADALERGLVLPKLANCGHYIAEDNTGQWHYINHANTWQTYPGPSTPLARSIADASPASPPKPSEDMVGDDNA